MNTFDYLRNHLRYPLDIDTSGCWIFTGGSKNGFHGSLYYEGESEQAHRLAWMLIKGKIPDGLFVLHKCDVGMCVNPDHLFLGTQEDNIADMDSKGRSNRPQLGEKNGRALISSLDVIEIRKLHSEGMIYAELARRYNLSISAIARIVTRQSWSHI